MITGSVLIRVFFAMLVSVGLYFTGIAVNPETASAAKCQGVEACVGVDPDDVGEGSCIGDFACFATGDDGGSVRIGRNSCNGPSACENAGDSGGSIVVGDGSCNGSSACEHAGDAAGNAEIGDGSCNGEEACDNAGGTGGNALVGDDSCNQHWSCAFSGYDGNGEVGNGSCNGEEACQSNGILLTRSIGNGSCNATRACIFYSYAPSGDIGNYSCNGVLICNNIIGLEIGDCEMNEVTPRECLVDRRPPNIGAGLSGLFNGMPTPLPTARSAPAPAATSPVISPPRTGDGGLADGSGIVDRGLIIGTVAVLTFAGIAFARRRRA